jgi:hypothetical protein
MGHRCVGFKALSTCGSGGHAPLASFWLPATGRHPAGSLSKVTELDCLVLARPFVAHSRECNQSEILTDGIRVCIQAIVGINVARIKYAAQTRFYLNAGREWYIPPDGPDFEEIKSWLCAVRF